MLAGVLAFKVIPEQLHLVALPLHHPSILLSLIQSLNLADTLHHSENVPSLEDAPAVQIAKNQPLLSSCYRCLDPRLLHEGQAEREVDADIQVIEEKSREAVLVENAFGLFEHWVDVEEGFEVQDVDIFEIFLQVLRVALILVPIDKLRVHRINLRPFSPIPSLLLPRIA